MEVTGFGIRVRACALIIENNSILLVEFDDEQVGVHYNLPAGGVEKGECIKEAVMREAREEACIDVEVGQLAFVYEYMNKSATVALHGVSMMFDCKIKSGMPKNSGNPDTNQTDVKWIPLSELQDVLLFPDIRAEILEYVRSDKKNAIFIEDLSNRK